MTRPRFPALYQLNTRVRLQAFAVAPSGRAVTGA